MNKLKRAWRYCKEKYDLLARKKYTTIAGTLVFFLIMSIVPLAFWLTLLLGKLPIDSTRIFRLSVFDSVKDVIFYVQTEAENATASASAVLLVTTLYSSTTLFYQMRRSGEIIYGFSRLKKGLRVRLSAFVLLLIVMLLAVVFAVVLTLGAWLFANYFSPAWEQVADYLLLIALSFGLVLLLNAYVCPYKTEWKKFIPGTIVTVVAWAAAVGFFSVYLKLGNMKKLYGALTTLIVFLLWLYVLMICFIVGVIINSERVADARKKRVHKKQKSTQTV